jgi:putative transposase
VIVTEESYTSKASFLDMDEMPVYKEEFETDHLFSGKRIHNVDMN